MEEAFERRLSDFPSAETEAAPESDRPGTQAVGRAEAVAPARLTVHANGIDKSVLAVAVTASLPQPGAPSLRGPSSHASFAVASHRIRTTCASLQPRALGRKASDEFAVPLCRVHHRAVHRARDERAWWRAARRRSEPGRR